MSHKFRHALVAYLAQKQGPSGTLGKKAVQKFVHILSSLSGKNLGYEFSFYTYGPFSRELASDLDILASSSVLSISYKSAENAYSITANPASESLISLLPMNVRAEADRVWSMFSKRTAKDLELLSTILFVADEEGIAVESADMTQRVKALKPKYSSAEVVAAQGELAAIRKAAH